jgi:glycosyltransferase involved in cell wall biosynthesis
MACGIPVVTSNISALPEVAEDAAYLIDPHSLDEIAEGIFRLLSDEELRSHYIKKGLERIRPFTWERCAAETLKVFQDIL